MPLHRRLPKRGFKSLTRASVAEVRLSDLEDMKAVDIDLAALQAERVVPRDALAAKVILSGELKRKVTLKGVKASKGARAAIEKAGGKYEEPAAAPAPQKKLAAKPKKEAKE
jgi:large subunit ribosomal protein L15